MADKPSAPRQPPRAVYVYSGPGAGVRSAGSAIEALRASLGRARVDTLSADALVDGAWAADAALLVIPGGADLPYCRELNGKGNAIIRGGRVGRWGWRAVGQPAGGRLERCGGRGVLPRPPPNFPPTPPRLRIGRWGLPGAVRGRLLRLCSGGI